MKIALPRTLRLATLTAVLGLATALPASALDLGALSEDERNAFRDEVRAYLLDNPEVLMEAFAILEQRQAEAQVQQDKDLVTVNADDIFNDGFSHVAGNPDGDYTIVEFVDYQCGYCRKAYEVLQDLLEEDGNIRLILKEFPILSEASLISARFAISAQQNFGEEAYAKLHDELIAVRGTVTEERLIEIANELGLDGSAIVAGMSSPEVDKVLKANRDLGKRLQITGTPAFVMQNTLARGYMELEQMEYMVSQGRAAQ
ncbi:DsbA family protein [Aliiroseovarius sp. F20344]|uniref:DsbA family protein n=1 Tax=Aliiroseovarius sp. F20344 TaxID=2926414 RepID=UPI001FF6C8DB|nr:DsbA family protein [Aliiroseovarius sp. F20344]MCK0143452.1 DsbA family protein [Aliiroseovarius sp. F20344]